MVAFTLVSLLGAIGLAVDAGAAYMMRAHLTSAVDAAGIAAARAVVNGSTAEEQRANAQRAAEAFFAENYPRGWLGSSATGQLSTQVAFDGGRINVTTSASVTAPMSFLGVFGQHEVRVAATATTTRRDLDMALVVDVTDSMKDSAGSLKVAAKHFLTRFNALTDRIALVHFAYGGVVDVPFRADQGRGFDRNALNAKIDAFDYNLGGYTNFSEGMWLARDQLNRQIAATSRSSMRVIVFFSDGSPNSFASYFNWDDPSSCTAPGVVSTGRGASGTPEGLWRHDQQNVAMTGGCQKGNGTWTALDDGAPFPTHYNARNKTDTEFPIVVSAPRVVTNRATSRDETWRNVNRAARNLGEAMAEKARTEGILVFTIGFSDDLTTPSGPDNEYGVDILRCMANTADAPARCRRPSQPMGVFCYAASDSDLKPCFSKLASEIVRLAK